MNLHLVLFFSLVIARVPKVRVNWGSVGVSHNSKNPISTSLSLSLSQRLNGYQCVLNHPDPKLGQRQTEVTDWRRETPPTVEGRTGVGVGRALSRTVWVCPVVKSAAGVVRYWQVEHWSGRTGPGGALRE